MTEWLAYIPATFPHYTRHTVGHSDQIVFQLSNLLFDERGEAALASGFSAMEAYLLIAAALLHDAGMVASEKEKLEILESTEWIDWITTGSGARRWKELEGVQTNTSAQAFAYNTQLRFLIAEFVRRSHHTRAVGVIQLERSRSAAFLFNDRILTETLAAICEAHGLNSAELDDIERFPHRREIRGDLVNVRFLAGIFRLGDLLDMCTDRACPLLLSAACPLPAESYAHWSQYGCITHRLVAPDRIELRAECTRHDEHRHLQNWCEWIVAECKDLAAAMARSPRHADWRPPVAVISGANATITVGPSKAALYLPFEWEFQLDKALILERFVKNAYRHPLAYLRELLQNSLDATRCRLYEVNPALGPRPDLAPEGLRDSLPINIRVSDTTYFSEIANEDVSAQLLTIDDNGIGMDREVIQRFFLQIGRSFYATESFRRNYAFAPTSRFGVGFLSVFEVSKLVTVSTLKSNSTNDQAIDLELTGPESYILFNRGARKKSGTSVALRLTERIEPESLLEFLVQTCRNVEFPVVFQDGDRSIRINPSLLHPVQWSIDDPEIEGGQIQLKHWRFDEPDCVGIMHALVRTSGDKERIISPEWYAHNFRDKHPALEVLVMPKSESCFFGLSEGYFRTSSVVSQAVDFRGASFKLTLGREPKTSMEQMLTRIWDGVLAAHSVAQDPDKAEWKYWSWLSTSVGSRSFWKEASGLVPMRDPAGKPYKLSSLVLLSQIEVATARITLGDGDGTPNLIHDAELAELPEWIKSEIFANRGISSFEVDDANRPVRLKWSLDGSRDTIQEASAIFLIELVDSTIAGGRLHHGPKQYQRVLYLNVTSALYAWTVAFRGACDSSSFGLDTGRFSRLVELLRPPLEYNGLYVEQLMEYAGAHDALVRARGGDLPVLPKVNELKFDLWVAKD